jgi:hypothetical protein
MVDPSDSLLQSSVGTQLGAREDAVRCNEEQYAERGATLGLAVAKGSQLQVVRPPEFEQISLYRADLVLA